MLKVKDSTPQVGPIYREYAGKKLTIFRRELLRPMSLAAMMENLGATLELVSNHIPAPAALLPVQLKEIIFSGPLALRSNEEMDYFELFDGCVYKIYITQNYLCVVAVYTVKIESAANAN